MQILTTLIKTLQLLGHTPAIQCFLSQSTNQPTNHKLSISNGRLTLTGDAVFLIFPHEMASSGLAPESEPSNSWAVLTYTQKSVPFLCQVQRQTTSLAQNEATELISCKMSTKQRQTRTSVVISKPSSRDSGARQFISQRSRSWSRGQTSVVLVFGLETKEPRSWSRVSAVKVLSI